MVSTVQKTTSTGLTATFSVPFPYLDKSHVKVYLDGVLKTEGVDYTWPTSGSILLSAGPPDAGVEVLRTRRTPTEPLTVFQPGNLDTADLNVAVLQPLYLAQEGFDIADILDGRPVLPEPADGQLIGWKTPASGGLENKLSVGQSVAAAKEWAINPEDDPVSVEATGNGVSTFSAYHWAQKALVAGAGNTGFVNIEQWGTDGAALASALFTGKLVVVPSTITSIALSAAQAATVLPLVDKIISDALDLTLAAGVHEVASGDIVTIGARSGGIRLIGAAPVPLTMLGVASVTGTAGAWVVTYNVADASGVAVGDWLKNWEIGPLPVLAGDNVVSYVLRERPLPGELAAQITNLRGMSFTGGTTAATFAGDPGAYQDVASKVLSPGDLITCMGQTRKIATVAPGSGPGAITVTTAWDSMGAAGQRFYTSLPNTGTITCVGTAVTGSGTLFLSEANAGDVTLVDGELIRIASIESDTAMTLAKAKTIGAGLPFSVLVQAAYHNGAHKVTAVGAGTVTVLNKSRVKPPVNRVVGGNINTITGATAANPVVITSAGHNRSNGDVVFITGVVGMTQINNLQFTVANKTDDTFELAGVNGSGYTAYSSGGKVHGHNVNIMRAIKTVLKQTGTGDGLKVTQGAHLPWMEAIALEGNGGGRVGLALNGRVPALPLGSGGASFGSITQHGYTSSVMLGPDVVVADWGYNAFLGHGCTLNARTVAFSGGVTFNVWLMEGAFANLRRAVISGAGASAPCGISLNGGSSALLTEAQIVGNGGDGLRMEVGSVAYAETPIFIGNAAQNMRLQGGAALYGSGGVSFLAGTTSSAGVFSTGCKATFGEYIIAANGGAGIDQRGEGSISALNAWITGNGSLSGARNINCIAGKVDASGAWITGTPGIGVYALNDSTVIINGAYLKNNVTAIYSDSAKILAKDCQSQDVTVVGREAFVDITTPVGSTPTLGGVGRANEHAAAGGIIRNGTAPTGWSTTGLRPNGGANLTFLGRYSAQQDCGSVPANQQLALPADITIPGATTAMVAMVNCNDVAAGLSYTAKVIAADTVRVYVQNHTGAPIDPPNATYTVFVIGVIA